MMTAQHSTAQHKHKAFTLSELLVSLSVLGLIAALTLPSIFNSISTARTKAVGKEAIQVITTLVTEGLMNGDIAEGDGLGMRNYIFDHINAAKVCRNGVQADGCFTGTGGMQPWFLSEPGVRLHSGVVIAFKREANVECNSFIMNTHPSIPQPTGKGLHHSCIVLKSGRPAKAYATLGNPGEMMVTDPNYDNGDDYTNLKFFYQ
jgi:prepilin-type N-terminal cleavage/methylation domain-containing protein